jgi:anti-sigma-K factor RskA
LKHERPNDESQEIASLYALGALSQFEAHSFERHLREGCAVCNAELSQFEKTVGLLSLNAAPVAPGAHLKSALAKRIKGERTPQPALAPREPRPAASRAALPWAVAACLAIAFAAIFYIWQNTIADTRGLQSRVEENDLEIQALSQELRHQSSRSDQLRTIIATLKKPGSAVIRLAVQPKEPELVAEVYSDKTERRWVVDVSLPPVPAGKTYQLWFIAGDAKISAGLIDTDARGRGFTTIEVPQGIAKVDAAAITVEPAGGSSQPTSTPIALAMLDAATR